MKQLECKVNCITFGINRSKKEPIGGGNPGRRHTLQTPSMAKYNFSLQFYIYFNNLTSSLLTLSLSQPVDFYSDLKPL